MLLLASTMPISSAGETASAGSSSQDAFAAAMADQDAGNYKGAQTKLLALIKQIEAKDPETVELIPVLVALSRAYNSDNLLTDAQKNAERAVKIAELKPPRTKTLRDRGLTPKQIESALVDLQAGAFAQLGSLFSGQFRDTEAEPLLERALAIWGPNSVEAAYPLSCLADIYKYRRQYDRAEKVYKQVIALREHRNSLNDPDSLATAVEYLGDCYYMRSDYTQAEASYTKAIDILTKNNLASSTTCAYLYGDLGKLNRRKGNLQAAEKAYRTQLDLLIKSKATASELEDPLKELGRALVELGRLGEAEPYYNQAYVSIANKRQVRKNVFIDVVIETQSAMATSVYKSKFGGNADDLAKTIADTKARLDPNGGVNSRSLAYADFLESVGFAYPNFRIKRQPLIPLLEEAIQIRLRVEGPDTPRIADDKFQIAVRLANLGGDYTAPALDAYKIWVKLRDRHDVRLKSFQPSILRLAYLLAGNAETKSQALEMATLARANLAPDSPNAGREWGGFGLLYENLGEFGQARTAYEKANLWFQAHNDPTGTARTAIADARICYLERDYDVAWQKAKAAEAICQKNWGVTHYQENVAGMMCLETLTAIARARGDLEASELYARMLTLKTKWLQQNSDMARHYLALAQVLSMGNDKSEATRYAQDAVSILSNLREKTSYDEIELAKAHLLLGGLALAKQDYKLADAEYRQAFILHGTDKSTDGVLGLVADLNGIAFTGSKLGKKQAAIENALLACDKLDTYIKTGFPELSFAEQCAFIKCVRDEINPLLSLGTTGDTTAEPFKYVMRWQGLLIDAVRRQTSLERSGDPQTVAQLRQIRQELSQLSSGAAMNNQAASTAAAIQTKTEAKEALERKLALSATVTTATTDPMLTLTPRDFVNSLSNDEALVDVLRYKDLLANKPAYYAFVVSKKAGVKGFRLGDADDIEKLSAQWLQAMASNSGSTRDVSILDEDPKSTEPAKTQIDLDAATGTVTQKLWTPIKAALPPGIHRVWICPDSQLATLPWSTMVDSVENGQVLTSQIDSPRAWWQLKAPHQTPVAQDFLLIGGIRFAQQSLFLPGTESEVADISKLAEPMKLHLSKLTGAEPTKNEVLRQLGTATYAHLATHGFFDQGDDKTISQQAAQTVADQLLASQRSFVTVSTGEGALNTTAVMSARNPLVMSGLLVAPAQGSNVNANDRLTAEELVGQDLSHCNLVVLSACNTGRGKDYEGQGVMGLRAALIGAGARGVLMSLWPVDDRATKELMKNFYQNLWNPTNPMQPVAALRAAQNTVRSAPGGKWKHPYYWAGWVFDGVGW